MNERLGFARLAWPETADALGFGAPDAPDGFTLRSEGDWLALVDRTPAPSDPLASALGTPGLWRVVQEGATRVRIHDLPLLCGVGGDDAGSTPSLAALSILLAWSRATLHGKRVPDWTPPPREEVESWFTPSHLNVRSGSLLAQGELIHEPARLALVFPELAGVPATLSPARRSWLDALLLDAQRRWRLARFGIDADTCRVRAEVDLTGIPAVWARPFVQLSLAALIRAVEWVLSPLFFLVDTGATSRALDRHSFQSLTRSTST